MVSGQLGPSAARGSGRRDAEARDGWRNRWLQHALVSILPMTAAPRGGVGHQSDGVPTLDKRASLRSTSIRADGGV